MMIWRWFIRCNSSTEKKTKNYSLQFLYESYRARSCRRPVLLERRARTNYSLQFLTLSSMRTTIIFTAIPRMVRPAKLFTAIPPRAENSIIRCNSSLSVCSGPLFRSAPLLALYSLQFLLMSWCPVRPSRPSSVVPKKEKKNYLIIRCNSSLSVCSGKEKKRKII